MINQESPQNLSQLIAELQQILDKQGDLKVRSYDESENRHLPTREPAMLGIVTDERGISKLDVTAWHYGRKLPDTIDIHVSLLLDD